MKPAGICFLIFLVCTSGVLFAQAVVLRGRVVDPRGSALPNAVVTLLEQSRVISQGKVRSRWPIPV